MRHHGPRPAIQWEHGGGSARKEDWLLWPVAQKTLMPSSVGAVEHPFMPGSQSIKERWMLMPFYQPTKTGKGESTENIPSDCPFQKTPLNSPSFLPHRVPLTTESFISYMSLMSLHIFCLPWGTLVPVKHSEPTSHGWSLPRSTTMGVSTERPHAISLYFCHTVQLSQSLPGRTRPLCTLQ